MVTGVWTGVGFADLKNFRIRIWIEKFETGADRSLKKWLRHLSLTVRTGAMALMPKPTSVSTFVAAFGNGWRRYRGGWKWSRKFHIGCRPSWTYGKWMLKRNWNTSCVVSFFMQTRCVVLGLCVLLWFSSGCLYLKLYHYFEHINAKQLASICTVYLPAWGCRLHVCTISMGIELRPGMIL